MSAPIHLERRWLIDAFGCFLQYDSMSQQLVTTPFTPQSFPNLFTFIPVPENFPHRAVLRLTNSIPAAIPPARFIRVNENEIAIQNLETNHYLSSRKNETNTGWEDKIALWEEFSLLSAEMIAGLSLLSDPDLITISDAPADGHLTFHQADSYFKSFAKIAGTNIKISENLPEIAKIANAKAHEAMPLTFITSDDSQNKISLTITPKRAVHLSSLTTT
ncbi:hypothetical protein FAI41_03380 [Acetobacteraceae bacterium]|nr:hypothetical protein FAI41_03380 [Acetobacteraceae bacterium]